MNSAETNAAPKRVLMLGTNVGSVDMVRYAQSLGHEVTVTDHLPAHAGAKAIADHVAMISTTDVDKLIEYAEAHAIDAVVAGVSETNLRSAIQVTEQLDLPFYCSSGQWDLLMDKSRFRKLCIEQGMPRPDTYFSGPAVELVATDLNQHLPVVIKPVDGSALKGITICHQADQIEPAIRAAREASLAGNILVESFVAGEEFTAAYVVVDGVPSLTSIDVRYPFAFEGMTTTFPILRVYPPSFAQDFINDCDAAVRRVCSAVALENACVFFQGIRTTDNRFAIFEAGLRMAGEAPYRFLEAVNGVNPMRHMVDSSLGGPITYDIEADDPFLGGGVCAVASLIYRGATVGSILGLSGLQQDFPEIINLESRYQPGDTVVADGTLRQIGMRFILRCSGESRLAQVLSEIERRIDVRDTDGQPMAIKPSPRLLGWS